MIDQKEIHHNHLLQMLQNKKPVINQKLKRCRQFKNNGNKISKTYIQNSPKQELVLQHVIQFKKQFQNHTDQNRQLFIYPKNECDVYKFICTTIRPSKLGFLQLYDYKLCADYLSKFIQYQQLDPPDQFPKCIPSPANTAKWQKGDCFDISILLTSILIGVGYDAYCVYGVAPKQITTKNEALMEYQQINRGIINQQQQDKNLEQISQQFQKISRKKKITSQFDAQKQERQKNQKQQLAKKALTIDDDEPDELAPDLYLGRRIHCWVLIRKGKRQVTQDLFIQPSTGRIYQTRKSPYLLIDAIFNHTNFFIHMQPKHRVQDIKFEMYQTMAWEYVMLQDQMFRNSGQDDTHQQQHGQTGKVDEDQKLKDLAQTLDMPPPWSPKIYIDKDSFLKGTPLGQSTVFYVKMKVEKYADYGQTDGLVEKFTIYEDYKKLRIKQIRYFYKHRSDKLEIRRRFPFQFKTVQQYGPGKMPHWRQVIIVDKRIRIIKYYPNRNVDGLIKRIEKIGQKTVEYYQNRDDKVISRSIRFQKVQSQQKKNNTTKDYYYDDNHLGKQVWVIKMTQKYERNLKKPANQQIAKLVVDVLKHKVIAYFHMEDTEISPITKQFSRDQILGISKTDSNEKKIDDPVTQQENQKILNIEKDCYQYMRTEQTIIADQLKHVHSAIQLQKTLHDKAREKFKQNLNKQQQIAQQEDINDYLRPFLQKRGLPINTKLEPEIAQDIKNEVMKKLKDRIIARAKIIQSRLQSQQQVLRQQQQMYQKRQQDKTSDNKELTDIKFKISILQSRSGRFQAMALQKFQEMDSYLANDPRMAALKQKQIKK